MLKVEKFLFFYSIVAVTGLLVASGIFDPRPLNLISVGLLAPILIYFWIKLTNPASVTAEAWTLRLFVSIAVLSGLFIYGRFLSENRPSTNSISDNLLSQSQKQNDELKAEIEKINSQIATITNEASESANKVQGESVSDFLLGTPSPTISASIMAKPGIASIDVYKEPSKLSKKIGILNKGEKYTYIMVENGWYKVPMPQGGSGWVSADQVNESR
jgi:hypothetical protein